MGAARRVAIALVVCLLRQATALSASPLQAIQSLDASLQSQLFARYGSLAAAGAAAEGVGVWRGCFLKGRVPDDAFDGAAWPGDAGARSRCQRAFAPVARVVGRHPRLARPALRALVEAALEDDAGAEAAALRSVVDGVGALEAVYGAGADAVVDAVLEAEDLAALLGTAASSGAGRFQRRAAAFEAMRRCADRVGDVEELAPLLASLGRRATAASGASRYGSDARRSRDGARGACVREAPPATEGFDGETLGRDLAALAPSERLLLCDGSPLFRARYGDRALRSAAPLGLDDGARVSPARAKRRLPRGRRGPLVVCVDTSYSMTGAREGLAKAVALAAARAASDQRRACVVLAFGASDELAELELPGPADPARAPERLDGLLDFLERGFGGGTDVISPLRRAVALLRGRAAFADADVLLVSDGELMDPPVDAATAADLDALRRSRGLRVAGLLVGRSRRGDGLEHAAPGSPFDALCDGVHTFLADHDDLALLMGASARPPPSTTALAAAARRPRRGVRRRGGPLFAAAVDADAAAVEAAPPAFPVAPADLEAAAAHLERGLVERSAEARLVLLGAVGREHVLFVGPPGVAKSLLCRRLGELFGGPSFEIALTRFTTPDDVFGPLSLAALKDDAYRRAADGFAQEAPAVFFDEIFRARSLLPALLALLNERVWQDGPHRRPAALVSAVAAANTLGGDDDDDDDDALYDRFLIRREVAPVSDAAVADLLLGDDVDAACPRAFLAPLLDVPKPPRAALPRFFAELFGDARAFLRDRGDYVSDRRLRKCADLVRVAARANGRGAVGPLDALLAAHVLWQRPESRQPLEAWLLDRVVPDDAPTFATLLRAASSAAEAADLAAAVDASLGAVRDAEAGVAGGQLFLAPDALLAARQALAPLAAGRAAALERLADRARAVAEGRELPDDDGDDDFAAPPRAAPAPAPANDDNFDLTMSKKKAKKELTAAEFRRWTAARADLRG